MAKLLLQDAGAMLQEDGFFILLDGYPVVAPFAETVMLTETVDAELSLSKEANETCAVTAEINATVVVQI